MRPSRFCRDTLFLFFLVSPFLHAAFEEKPLSARTSALGESGAGDADGPDAWLMNPAALRFLPGPGALLGHTQLLGDAALPFSAAAGAFPTARWGSYGAAVTRFGDSLYGETEVTAAQAFRPAPALAVGAAVTGSFLSMARYGSATAWGLDAGVLGRPHPRVSWGFSVKRLNHPRLAGARDGLPSLTRAGVALSPLRSARVTLDMVKPRESPFSTRVGLDVALAPVLSLRVGGESRPARFTMGLGVRSPWGRVDYAFLSHPFLGDEHHVSLSFSWGRPDPLP